nr:class I SAM-dependent methyltransferase [Gordonia sp. SID5947]
MPLAPGQRALDVGCGPGQWTELLAQRLGAGAVSAVDPSPSFVAACRQAVPGADVQQATADALPFPDDAFDLTGASLVVHFMPDPRAGLIEMARVTRPGGEVAVTGWDLAGARAPMATLWSAFAELDLPLADETRSPGGSSADLERILTGAGLEDVDTTEFPVVVGYRDFDEWWEPYQHGVGPIGESIAALDSDERERLRKRCADRFGSGSFEIDAVGFGARGRVGA